MEAGHLYKLKGFNNAKFSREYTYMYASSLAAILFFLFTIIYFLPQTYTIRLAC